MSEDRVERRLTAMLTADVVGYSRQMGAVPPLARRSRAGWLEAL